MNITKTCEGDKLMIALEGRLDTNTSPELDKVLNDSLEQVKELVLDFAQLVYISSAGLRVMLKAQKAMNKKGSMVVTNVRDEIMEIFDVTGFTDILTIS